MFELLLSISPVVIVMVGIVLLNQRSDRVAIVSMIYTGLVAYFYFSKGTDVILADAKGGLIGTLQICSIIFGAFCLLNVVRFSGAMDRINITISDFSNDKRVLVILIAFCFGAFIEGAAGAGTPAAIAAPFLVALGFDPMVAVVASLLSNGLPASFGGAGVTTIMGSAAINDIVPLMEASKMTGRFHMIGGLITPMLLIYLLYGKKALQSKGIKGYLLSVGAAYGATYFVVSNFIGPELNSMSVGLVSLSRCFVCKICRWRHRRNLPRAI